MLKKEIMIKKCQMYLFKLCLGVCLCIGEDCWGVCVCTENATDFFIFSLVDIFLIQSLEIAVSLSAQCLPSGKELKKSLFLVCFFYYG